MDASSSNAFEADRFSQHEFLCTAQLMHVMGLSRLDVWVPPGAARRRNHFLLVTSLGVWDLGVNAFISHRREAFTLGEGQAIGKGDNLNLRLLAFRLVIQSPQPRRQRPACRGLSIFLLAAIAAPGDTALPVFSVSG